MRSRLLILPLSLLILSTCATLKESTERYDTSGLDGATRKAYRRVESFLQNCIHQGEPIHLHRMARIDSIHIDQDTRHIRIFFNDWFGTIPVREDNTLLVHKGVRKALGRGYRNYKVDILVDEFPLEDLIPNHYREKLNLDKTRLPLDTQPVTPIVRNVSNPWQPTTGLNDRHIALWHSHGWYYERKLDRWEFQRARLFQTIEDLLPMSFTIPYLIPMLENAGANVFVPRERDLQIHEVIVDNDIPNSGYTEAGKSQWSNAEGQGFAPGNPPYLTGDNPFRMGTSRQIRSGTTAGSRVSWVPDIPTAGEYAVTIAYRHSPEHVRDAHYRVNHLGGHTDFRVNQQMGGGTWIYLGTFKFAKGQNPESGSVVLTNESETAGSWVSADAVRFGGGMGNIARNDQTSGRPRFVEGARYYLQYAGMPDTLVYSFNADTIDYNDDYQSRAEWANYLRGAPYGPNRDRDVPGLGIPIDLTFSFHTDAGITRNDTVIGTLSIYCSEGADTLRTFPDGTSRLANRDFADILQTQIVEDIRAQYDPSWNRRYLWDRAYSESYRPNVPGALLELLSHQNFVDMKFAMDPAFRFFVSRSIYKAMGRFLASRYQTEFVVQPLPVDHFQAEFVESGSVQLKWQPVSDPLEPSAEAQHYIVYTRQGEGGFDNGVLAERPWYRIDDLQPGVIYSFKVSAVNAGGESFLSEVLSVCHLETNRDPVLLVNGFDRIAAAATVETEQFAGFINLQDQGVPDGYDLNFTGEQYDFAPQSPWLDDDAPGHGASYANFETTIIPGNTHDFPMVHGEAIRAAGYPFVSVSDECVMDGATDLSLYKTVDLICGEERSTDGPRPQVTKRFQTFPVALQEQLRHYCEMDGNLLITGAYVGSDLLANDRDSADVAFAADVLKFKFRTDHAARTGKLHSVNDDFLPRDTRLQFNSRFNPQIYTAESPDAIEPADESAATILRYSENNMSAAVAHDGETDVIVCGFPFETILTAEQREQFMKAALDYFERH